MPHQLWLRSVENDDAIEERERERERERESACELCVERLGI